MVQVGLLNYLKRDRHGTYWFRRHIGLPLRDFMPGARRGKANWMHPLGTKDPATAKRRYPGVLADCQRDFELAGLAMGQRVREELDAEEIAMLAGWFRDHAIIDDEEFRVTGYLEDEQLYRDNVARLEARSVAAIIPYRPSERTSGLSERQIAAKHNALAVTDAGLKRAVAASDISLIAPEVDIVLDIFGIEVPKASPSYRRLCLAFLAAFQEANAVVARRLNGEAVASPVLPEPSLEKGRVAKRSGKGAGLTLRDALPIWRNVQQPNENTYKEYKRSVRDFEQVCGNIPIADIRRSDATKFRETLQKLPHNRHLRGELARMTVAKQIKWREANHGCKALAPGTINKLLGGLATICETMRDDGKIEADVWENPFRVRKVADASEGRLPYDADDLKVIFSSSIYTEGKRPKAGGGEASFWLPILAMLHGTREEELAQLLLTDIRCEDGIWYYEVIADDGSGKEPRKRVKIAGKRLRIPIHAEAIGCGFLTFVAGRKEKPGSDARLFADLKPDSRGKVSGNWSKWWGRWAREELKITDRRKVFHSFRHGWKDAARAAGLDEAVSDAITGHSGGGVGRRYGTRGNAGYPLAVLKVAIDRVSFPVNLEHLHKAAQL